MIYFSKIQPYLKMAIFCIASLFMLQACHSEKAEKKAASNETTLAMLDAEPISIDNFSGKWVFINYWASWCKPCWQEIPELNAFYAKYKDHNVMVLGVNFDHVPVDQIRTLGQEMNIHFPILLTNPARMLGAEDISVIPVTLVLSPDGKLTQTLYGEQTMASLEKIMEQKEQEQNEQTTHEQNDH